MVNLYDDFVDIYFSNNRSDIINSLLQNNGIAKDDVLHVVYTLIDDPSETNSKLNNKLAAIYGQGWADVYEVEIKKIMFLLYELYKHLTGKTLDIATLREYNSALDAIMSFTDNQSFSKKRKL